MHRIIKIGGSLLMRRDLRTSMTAWLTQQSPAEQTSVVVGGGETIDAMRRLDAIHGLHTADMHWRCVRLLRATFEVTRELFPEWRTIDTGEAFDAYQRSVTDHGGVYLIAADAFFAPAINAGLPETWATTSDAIAAYLCRRLGADELVLLKSCAIPPVTGIDAWVEIGIVDDAILPLAAEIPNLRVEQLA